MGSFSLVHWMLVVLVIIVLFGSGKLSTIMSDMAKAFKTFKKDIGNDEIKSP